jgi:hypothetical protein
MEKDYLILKRAAVSLPSGQWSDDDFDVLANGEVVGRIYKANAAPVGSPWMWTLVFWQRPRSIGAKRNGNEREEPHRDLRPEGRRHLYR